MDAGVWIWVLLGLPTFLAGLCLALRSPRQVLILVSVGGAVWGVVAGVAACTLLAAGSAAAAYGWLHVDALSAYHLLLLGLVQGASSIYAWGYFRSDVATGELTAGQARRFGGLWFGAAAAMSLVLLSNNLGLMWVGIEATTLLTAFLICLHVSPLSLEATWKYLLVCSVGVAFAFVGTLLVGASAQPLGLDPSEMLLWTRLRASAPHLAAGSMKLAFLFMLVGYGTKAGLAPLHSWLPDAHSQAPAPVSALFSGFMLNAAFYCILRVLPLVEEATGSRGWGRDLLTGFGVVSILVAAAFIAFQRDGKRLLAYSSVEHLGVMALGVGLGGVGTVAALWHALNHAIAKPLAFFAVGRLGKLYGTHDLGALAGAARRSICWGVGFCGGLLALIGMAPFAIFMSEFQVLRAAAEARAFGVVALFLVGTTIVFVGALRHVIGTAWGEAISAPAREPVHAVDVGLVGGALLCLLVLGVWLPASLANALSAVAKVIGGGP